MHSLVNVWKKTDLTFNNDDLRRPKMGLIFISSLKKETIKFVFILEDMVLSIVNVWKKKRFNNNFGNKFQIIFYSLERSCNV